MAVDRGETLTSHVTVEREFVVQDLFNVEDWIVVVTGGATGISLVITQRFANNGAKVYNIVGRRQEAPENAVKQWGSKEKLANPKGEMIPVVGDVASKDGIAKFAQQIEMREKKLDVLVNNAGLNLSRQIVEKGKESAQALRDELWKKSWDDWEDVYFFMTVAFIPLLQAANIDGHAPTVINISSMCGGSSIRVTSIAPGVFPSQMIDEANKSQIVEPNYGEKRRTYAGGGTGRRQGVPRACNEHMYGQTVVVDGGYCLKNP
ncbi:NAD(P)-binding protein [Panus rudis PR-1116 ss-1]|nr:NAD(P)-binding protein [Panus rudis PR-1116 ss-1]